MDAFGYEEVSLLIFISFVVGVYMEISNNILSLFIFFIPILIIACSYHHIIPLIGLFYTHILHTNIYDIHIACMGGRR